MLSIFRTLLPRAALIAGALALPLPATAQQGDPRPGFAEILAPDRLAGIVANFGIAALRTQMEVEYQHLSTDILRGQVSLSGVTLRPQLPHDRARLCEITLDRVTISASPFAAVTDISAARVGAVGAAATLACLPPDTAMPLRTMGLGQLAFDRVGVDLEYVTLTGGLLIDGTAALNGIGVLDLSAAGTILPRPGPNGRPGDPAIRLTRAVLSFQDRGGWDAAEAIMPPALRQPDAVVQLGTEGLIDLLTEGGTQAIGAAERAFVDDLMAEIARFMTDPGELTLEAVLPMGGLTIEPEAYDKPARLISLLALDARSAPSARAALIDSATLARLGAEDLSDDERLTLGAALLSGEGVPRAPSRALEVLAPLLASDDPAHAEAVLLSARAMAARDPAQAYELALQAPGAVGVVSLLDGLETQLGTGDVLDLQAGTTLSAETLAPALPQGNDPRALRDLAVAYFTGASQPRNYANAYLMALLADAAGDVGAPQLLTEITGRFDLRGPEVRRLWAARSAEIEALALSSWIEGDLAARYRID
ncbi:hypothetical protein roselon_02478 [Roseibacterium elongatum DSM 19469]|uniref:Uncharacterized protein n=1 Tax=Roseicyclus elongatus DSM 19469 TaxID=1294273 RepID=W8RUA2_9RHOB|nr:hypothetical protein [Roseibacterium elongatum]AHM04799.1 hypothetical protein roselon_02478 [Roseibacterium elongatum DSM 19469]